VPNRIATAKHAATAPAESTDDDVKRIITTLPKTLDRQQVDEAHKNLVAAYPFGHLIPGPDGFDFVVEVPDEPEEDKNRSQNDCLSEALLLTAKENDGR
jgi:hypothetical protein